MVGQMVEARSRNRVDLVGKRNVRIKNNSHLTNKRGKRNRGKPEMKRISINLGDGQYWSHPSTFVSAASVFVSSPSPFHPCNPLSF